MKYKENPDPYKQRSRNWRDKNPEKKKIQNKEYRTEHPELYKNHLRNWRNKNPERDKQQHHNTYLKYKDRYNAEAKQRYNENKGHYITQSKINYNKNKGVAKAQVISHYSNGKMICNCCGEATFDFLTIDHIEGRKKHNHDHSMTGTTLYRWLINNNYPQGFQVLCWNCNVGRFRNGGTCPHLEKMPRLADIEPQRRVALQYYSKSKHPKCVCCGEDTLTFLDIDHEHNDGRHHRDKHLVKWVRVNNYPDNLGLRVLCVNCNSARDARKDKSCPHGEIRLPKNKFNKPDMRTRCDVCKKRFIADRFGKKHCSTKCYREHHKISQLNIEFPKLSNRLFWKYLVNLEKIRKLHRSGMSWLSICNMFDLGDGKFCKEIMMAA